MSQRSRLIEKFSSQGVRNELTYFRIMRSVVCGVDGMVARTDSTQC